MAKLCDGLLPSALDRAKEGKQRPLSNRQLTSHEDQRAAGTSDFASTQDEVALPSGVQALAAKLDCYARPLKHWCGDRKEAVVSERQAAVDVARGVQVLLLNPKGATNCAVRLLPVPERAAVHFKGVVVPGSPPCEFALNAV